MCFIVTKTWFVAPIATSSTNWHSKEHIKEISRNRMPNTYFVRLLELYNGRKSLLRISKNNKETHHKPEILLCCWSRYAKLMTGKNNWCVWGCQTLSQILPEVSIPNPTKSWSSKSCYKCRVKCDSVEINYFKSHTQNCLILVRNVVDNMPLRHHELLEMTLAHRLICHNQYNFRNKLNVNS